MSLKKVKYKVLTLNIRRCDIFEGVAKKSNETSSRVYLPADWDGKRVIVVLKDGQ